MIEMPIFMKPENRKWVDEIQKEDGSITYKAKKDAPEEIKNSIKKYKDMLKKADRYGYLL